MVDTNFSMLPKSFYTEVNGQNKLTVDKTVADKVQLGVQASLNDIPEARQKAFLALVNDLAPGDLSTPQDIKNKLASLQNAAKLTADLPPATSAYVGNIAKFLARAMIEMASEQRQNALADRMAARETAKAELISQAGQMEKAADKMAQGALTSLITGVIGGAISVGASLGGAIAGASQLSKMSTATGMKGATPDAIAAAKTAFDKGQTISSTASSFAQVGTAFGDITKTGGSSSDGRLQADAKREEAQGSRHAAEAQYAQQAAELKKDVQDTMSEMIKQIINFIKELKEAEVDAMRALTRV